jgi:hypothetical protein
VFVKAKEWLKHGAREGLLGLGAMVGLASPWAVLILLIIIVIAGLVGWAFLHVYGLVTAFVGFVAGMAFLWFLSHIVDLNEHIGLTVIPIVLAVLGYISEHLNVWKAPLTVTLNLKAIAFAENVTVTLDTILLFIVLAILVIQLVLSIKES